MSEVNETESEVIESMTGHDEMAIAQHFGETASTLYNGDYVMFTRALVFVTRRRIEGVNDDDARNYALDMTQKVLATYFAQESEESGKEEPVDEPQPESEPSSL